MRLAGIHLLIDIRERPLDAASVLAPLGVADGREKAGLVVSPGHPATVRDQTAPLATIGANSSARSGAPLLQALAQLSETMIMLADEGSWDTRVPFMRR